MASHSSQEGQPYHPQLPGVKTIVAIASGKGGVGKTTVTVNLALALLQMGTHVGIFDADIYGPNVPLMLGVHQRQKRTRAYATLVRSYDAPASIKPLERYGLRVMSTGLLLAEDQVIDPPAGAVGQLVVQTLRDIIWGDLDVLLIDLPPSAGEPQKSLLSLIRVNGVVIVTTPQDLSLLDAGRSLLLFQEASVPILGVVENMSYFLCPSCNERHEIFQRPEQARSGSRWPAMLEKAPVLGRIPLTGAISMGINSAHPLMQDQPDSAPAESFRSTAMALMARVADLGR